MAEIKQRAPEGGAGGALVDGWPGAVGVGGGVAPRAHHSPRRVWVTRSRWTTPAIFLAHSQKFAQS